MRQRLLPSRFPCTSECTSGFTIIELVVTFVVLAIVTSTAIPRFMWLRDRIDVNSAANSAEGIFNEARQLAIARAARTVTEIDTALGTLTIRIGTDTVRHRTLRDLYGVTLRATRSTIVYSPVGAGIGVSNLTLIVSKQSAADTLTISRLGRVRR